MEQRAKVMGKNKVVQIAKKGKDAIRKLKALKKDMKHRSLNLLLH